jgi:hypothetical protein
VRGPWGVRTTRARKARRGAAFLVPLDLWALPLACLRQRRRLCPRGHVGGARCRGALPATRALQRGSLPRRQSASRRRPPVLMRPHQLGMLAVPDVFLETQAIDLDEIKKGSTGRDSTVCIYNTVRVIQHGSGVLRPVAHGRRIQGRRGSSAAAVEPAVYTASRRAYHEALQKCEVRRPVCQLPPSAPWDAQPALWHPCLNDKAARRNAHTLG